MPGDVDHPHRAAPLGLLEALGALAERGRRAREGGDPVPPLPPGAGQAGWLATMERVGGGSALVAFVLFLVTLRFRTWGSFALVLAAGCAVAWALGLALAGFARWRRAAARREELRFMSELPMVIDGYVELVERPESVGTLRVTVALREAPDGVDAAFLEDALRGAGAQRASATARQVDAHFRLGGPTPAQFSAWFRGLAERVIVPLDRAVGVARVELRDV